MNSTVFRVCLLLCGWHGFTQAEVATVLGVSQSTVARHFRWALEKVREIAPLYA